MAACTLCLLSTLYPLTLHADTRSTRLHSTAPALYPLTLYIETRAYLGHDVKHRSEQRGHPLGFLGRIACRHRIEEREEQLGEHQRD